MWSSASNPASKRARRGEAPWHVRMAQPAACAHLRGRDWVAADADLPCQAGARLAARQDVQQGGLACGAQVTGQCADAQGSTHA